MTIKKTNIISSFFLVLTLLLLPPISAVTLQNTILNTTEPANLSITIGATPKYVTTLIVSNLSIYFENMTDVDGAAEKLTMNITNTNSNYLGTDLPYISATTKESKQYTWVVPSGIPNVYVTFHNLSVDNCHISSVTSSAGTIGDWDCNNKILLIEDVQVTSGSNTIAANFGYRTENEQLCSYVLGSYGNFAKFVPTFFTILIVLVIISMIVLIVITISNPNWYKEINWDINWDFSEGVDFKIVFLGIGIIAILMVVSIIVLYFMCAV